MIQNLPFVLKKLCLLTCLIPCLFEYIINELFRFIIGPVASYSFSRGFPETETQIWLLKE